MDPLSEISNTNYVAVSNSLGSGAKRTQDGRHRSERADVEQPHAAARFRTWGTDIPEADGMTWNDDFFERWHQWNIVAVFDLDHGAMRRMANRNWWTTAVIFALLLIGFVYICVTGWGTTMNWQSVAILVPFLSLPLCFLWGFNEDSRNAELWHLAVTRTGVRFVMDDDQVSAEEFAFPNLDGCTISMFHRNDVELHSHALNGEPTKYAIPGVQKSDAFIKLVNAMIKKHKRKRPTVRELFSDIGCTLP